MITNQYLDSWGLRGHNTPEYAKYLGYLDVRELYPGGVAGAKSLRSYFADILAGQLSGNKDMK